MNRKRMIAILLAVLIGLSALLAFIMSSYQFLGEGFGFPFSTRAVRVNPGDIELYYTARTILSTVNIVLTVVLIFNYVGIYLKTKSEFTLGLTMFATFFLIKDISWSPFIIGWAGFGMFGLGPFAFLPDLFEMAALLVLFYLSVKY
ncbi:MAG: hypothetical protein M1540_00675 [Candidatus Bathyarchaeota archaeon]|nr:hypothetical protein [Candidatus Bathyarchaeota archaeon]